MSACLHEIQEKRHCTGDIGRAEAARKLIKSIFFAGHIPGDAAGGCRVAVLRPVFILVDGNKAPDFRCPLPRAVIWR